MSIVKNEQQISNIFEVFPVGVRNMTGTTGVRKQFERPCLEAGFAVSELEILVLEAGDGFELPGAVLGVQADPELVGQVEVLVAPPFAPT